MTHPRRSSKNASSELAFIGLFPLVKKPAVIDIENFRPINITSSICRVLERIIRNKIYRHLIDNNLINSTQQGFLKGRSTTTALLTYTNDIVKSLDKNMCIDSAYFDFSKAFDSVRHDFLIQKLIKIGINSSLLNWIIDYFSNRIQAVNVHGCLSSDKQVSSGVIQGSVLGPIFFTIYVNDIDHVIKSSTILKYADDVRIYRSFNSDISSQSQNEILFQNDINAFSAWSLKWGLNFNLSTCCILHFGRSYKKSDYKVFLSNMTEKILEKDLGVLFSVKLKFEKHIDAIVRKANRQLGIIVRVFKDIKLNTILSLY